MSIFRFKRETRDRCLRNLDKGTKIGVTSVSFAGDADLMSSNNGFVFPNGCAFGKLSQLQISKAQAAEWGCKGHSH